MNAFDDIEIDKKSAAYEELVGLDAWREWTPTRTGWTDTGTPTVSGRLKFLSRLCFFEIKVVPGTNIATTAGTSYTSLPVPVKGGIGGMATMMNVTTNVAVGNCVIDATNSRCYVPTQVASGNTFAICGWYEV
ncbi:MAG: hypothetical protein FJX76_01480 [Armatimonadetes bacterium]|nr:hypothetical protein [Armatimonadota bacterium]MBM3738939.1 hypothetical protein [Acidobacteriota bacterium]